METTEDYAIWSKCAERVDKMNDFDEWSKHEDDAEFDLGTMRTFVKASREVRSQQDVAKGMHMLSSFPYRGASGVLTDGMFKYATGTKEIVDEYFDEVEQLLETVVESPSIHVQEKYVFFKRIAQNHGRTALMLSGGAALGMYHLGVLKALWQADMMPKVITGSSAGSIVGSFICTHRNSEIDEMFFSQDVSATLKQMNLNLDAFDPFGPRHAMRRMFWRLLVGGALMDVGRLHDCIKSNVGDVTFQEAYELSGRVLNVTVTSTREYHTTLVLNYLTAPDVLVRTAVCASCAVSGVFAPVELLAKNAQGEIVPYCPSRQLWCDGSINMDLPIKRITELFNINNIIVSQVNPHVIPFLDRRTPGTPEEPKGYIPHPKHAARWVCSEMKHLTLQAHRLGLVPSALLPVVKILDQTYTGAQINILPVSSVTEVLVSLQNPTAEYMEHCITEGQRNTWPFLTQIRYQTRLEHALDACFDKIVLGLMNEFERISTRNTDDAGWNLPRGREASTVSACGTDRSDLSDGLVANPKVKPWKQEPLMLLADEDEMGQETDKVRKLRDSQWVLERLHTFHPAKSHRRSHCGSAMSPCASAVEQLTGLSRTSFHLPPLDLGSFGDKQFAESANFANPQKALAHQEAPTRHKDVVGMTLPKVLDWIEANVRAEHKMRVAQYAMYHTGEVASIIQSQFDQKEELMLQLITADA
eukprot:GGOE01056336.1.p1 GENE.GGOE01056336.1~~GGOE01056336.1.p1  ORF type:complete len:761 (+),score=198.44 GGOE01056336.1:186-2285(+)